MSTIAIRDGKIAADTALSSGGIVCGRASKLLRLRDPNMGWIGVSGSRCHAENLRKWLEGTLDKMPPSMDEISAIWLQPDGTIWCVDQGLAYQVDAPFLALGSGEQLALGAMAAGATAETAVRLACEFDQSSALPLEVRRRDE